MHSEKKGVGLNPQSQLHYIDHLAPICILMNIPLLFTDEKNQLIGRNYYPELNVHFMPEETVTREYLISNYDVIFMSDLWDKRDFHAKYAELERKYQKKLRQVHCPHGFSDKGFYLKNCVNEDIGLLYGQNMIDLLKSEHVLNELPYHVFTGNYRYTYFKKHQIFFNTLYEQEIQSRFEKKQPTILYAPTWKDREDSTSFFDVSDDLFKNLPDSYNMIVKVHPQIELEHAGFYYHIIGKYEKRPNLLFLNDFPLVYPLLAHCDLYIGDMSSIGYDFLTFNKPMFFLNHLRRNSKIDRRLYLFRAGIEVKPDAYPLIYQLIEANLLKDAEHFTKIRSELYQYTFGEEKTSEEIKKEILEMCETPYRE
jgi:CDP-Glycerol:Poly(glycerophosphate) glycerophosphotransferase